VKKTRVYRATTVPLENRNTSYVTNRAGPSRLSFRFSCQNLLYQDQYDPYTEEPSIRGTHFQNLRIVYESKKKPNEGPPLAHRAWLETYADDRWNNELICRIH